MVHIKKKNLWKDKEKKSHAGAVTVFGKNRSICETAKKEREIRANFAVAPQAKKVNSHSEW